MKKWIVNIPGVHVELVRRRPRSKRRGALRKRMRKLKGIASANASIRVTHVDADIDVDKRVDNIVPKQRRARNLEIGTLVRHDMRRKLVQLAQHRHRRKKQAGAHA